MAIKHFTTSININESNNINIGVIKQNDNIKLEISIFKDTMPLDLSQNSIKSIFKRSDKLILEQIKDINTENNKVIINIKNKATAINGILEMELELIDNLGKCITQTFYFTILPIIPLNQALENTNNIESLELLKNIKFDDVVLNNNILTFMANTKQIKSIELQLNPTKNNNSFWKPMISKECLLSWEKSNSIIPPEPKNIKGDTGATGAKGEPGIKGDTGATGAKGEPGTEGKSAYQIWLSLGNTGTEQDFINTFKGIKGDKGDTGATGATGAKGEPGVKGDTGATGAKGEPGTFNINENYPTLNTTNKTVLGAINEINSKSTGGNGNNNVIPKVTTAPLENEIFLSQLAGATYKFRNQQSVTVNGNDILFNTNDSAIEIEFTSNGAIEIDVNKKSNGYYLINSNTGQDNIPWESKLKKYVFLGVTGNYIRIIVNNSGWGVTVNSKSINDLCFNSIVGIKNFAFSQLKMKNEINILKNEINTLKQVIYNISVLPKS
ncbi:MAG: collagen-like triple helix repeat-containing protein [Mycoplasmoidaceae bacterium]